jgi:structure-specific recognition protein 1
VLFVSLPPSLDGFRQTDKGDVAAFCARATGGRVTLQDAAVDTRGRNWGDLELTGANIAFSHASRGDGFELPVTEVSQVVLQSKNELALELNLDDHVISKDEVTLSEVRFYVPAGDDPDRTQAMDLRDAIVSRAGLGENEGEGICAFPETLMLVPRGRFTVDVLPRALKISGKTHDYKLSYTSFTGLFALPNPDQRQVFFVLGLDPPIRQGQTSYPHLVAQFPSDAEDETFDLNLDDELLKAHPKLAREMSGPPLKVLSRLVRSLSGRDIQRPGPFASKRGTPTIRCSNRANDGRLYILKDAFFFVPKPVHLPFDDIHSLGEWIFFFFFFFFFFYFF